MRRPAPLRPALPLLAALPLAALLCAHAADAPAAKPPVPPPVPTEIESGSAEMLGGDKENTLILRDRVTVTATNLRMTCDQLVVVMRRRGDTADTLGEPQNFKSLVATGSVRIEQAGREATCERAEIFPSDDRVVLTGNPRVRTGDGQWEGGSPRIELLRGERIVRMLSEDGKRPHFTLPPLKDLGFDPDKAKEAPKPETAAPAQTEAAAPAAATPVITVPPITPPPR